MQICVPSSHEIKSAAWCRILPADQALLRPLSRCKFQHYCGNWRVCHDTANRVIMWLWCNLRVFVSVPFGYISSPGLHTIIVFTRAYRWWEPNPSLYKGDRYAPPPLWGLRAVSYDNEKNMYPYWSPRRYHDWHMDILLLGSTVGLLMGIGYCWLLSDFTSPLSG